MSKVKPLEEKFEYHIIDEKPDHTASVIEKTGIKARFTLADIKADKDRLKKLLLEFSGQKQIEDAKKTNIEEHHPFVKDLTPEQLFTAHMYNEIVLKLNVLNDNVGKIEQGLASYDAEEAEIAKQVGVALPLSELDTPSNEEKKEQDPSESQDK